jgi:hypothetical protein
LSDIPLVKGFVSRKPIGFQSTSVQDFYKERDRLVSLKKSYDKLVKDDNNATADKFRNKNPDMILSEQFVKTAKTIGDLNDKVQNINKSDLDDKSKKERTRELEKQMTEYARNMLDKIDKYKRSKP